MQVNSVELSMVVIFTVDPPCKPKSKRIFVVFKEFKAFLLVKISLKRNFVLNSILF